MMKSIYRSAAGERAVRDAYRQILAGWPVPHEQYRIPTREGETFVIACGEAHRPPLVLLHGGHANSAMWMLDVARWSREFRVFCVDVIGEAGSSAASRPPLAGDAHASWLDDVAAHLGLDRFALVGVSLGGWLVLDYATRRPQRVRALTVLCPAGVGRQKLGIVFEVLLLRLMGARGRRLAAARVLGRAADDPPAQAVPLMALMTLIHRHFIGRMVKFPVFEDETLARLHMPCLAIVGGRDALLDSAETRQRLEANLPDVTVRWLPEAGHLITGQTEIILDFLRASAGDAVGVVARSRTDDSRRSETTLERPP